MLAGISILIKDHHVSRHDLDKILYQSLQEGDRIAAILMPKGQELSYQDFSGLLEKAPSAPLNKALKDIGILFPGFRLAAGGLTR